MGLRSTFRPQFGPFRLNTGVRGATSLTLQALGLTFRLWDRKGTRPGLSSVDLPGPISYRPGKSRRQDERPNLPPFSLNPKAQR